MIIHCIWHILHRTGLYRLNGLRKLISSHGKKEWECRDDWIITCFRFVTRDRANSKKLIRAASSWSIHYPRLLKTEIDTIDTGIKVDTTYLQRHDRFAAIWSLLFCAASTLPPERVRSLRIFERSLRRGSHNPTIAISVGRAESHNWFRRFRRDAFNSDLRPAPRLAALRWALPLCPSDPIILLPSNSRGLIFTIAAGSVALISARLNLIHVMRGIFRASETTTVIMNRRSSYSDSLFVTCDRTRARARAKQIILCESAKERRGNMLSSYNLRDDFRILRER